jgi:dTMP kinase
MVVQAGERGHDGDRRYRRGVDRGRLITIEGVDGAGKTTLAAALAKALGDRGVEVRLLREPGGVEASERIRALLADPTVEISPRAEALLFAAARAELVERELTPELEKGTWVVLDRFVDSSLAYQGAGRELGVQSIRAMNEFATGRLRPDRTLLLRVEPQTGRARLGDRGGGFERLELEDDEFFERIASAYDDIAAAEPERVRVIDANAEPGEVLAAALDTLGDLLPEPAHGAAPPG